MRSYISYILSASIVFGISAHASDNERIFLNDRAVDCIVSGNNIGNMQLSARGIFEAAGFTVQWFPDENRVTAFNADTNISLFADSDIAYINNKGYKISDAMDFENGVSVISVSLAADLLDADIRMSGNDIYFSSAAAEDSSGWQYDVLELVNDARAEYGLNKLIWNSKLAEAAYRHCLDMSERGYFSHNTPEGKTPFDRLSELGISYTAAAENIAAGQPDPESVFEAWMNSPGHRANILNPKLKEIGIAFVRGGTYGIYWAQEFASVI